MKVSELIAALQKMPQDARVIITTEPNWTKYDNEVRDVILNDSDKEFNNETTVELDNWPSEGYLKEPKS